MKRNILLLTAVVLAAVMLTGCILPFMGIKVSYDLPEGVFTEDKLVKKVKKGSIFEPELKFADLEEAYTFADFDVVVTAGEKGLDIMELGNLEEGAEGEEEVVGIKFTIKDVGKKDIKITVTLKDAGDDVVDGE